MQQIGVVGHRCECRTAWTSMLLTPAPFRSIFYTPDFWVSFPELLISGLQSGARASDGPKNLKSENVATVFKNVGCKARLDEEGRPSPLL